MKRINRTLGLLSIMAFMIASCSKVETPQTAAKQQDAAALAAKDEASQTTATQATVVASDTSTTAAGQPAPPPDFDAKTSDTVNFNGQFMVRNLHFEARGVVINLKMTVDCLNEVEGNHYSVFVHVVKDGKTIIGMPPLDLVTEKRQLHQGEKQDLNFLTQLSAKFDPSQVDGIRFGVIQTPDDGKTSGRLPIIESKLKLEDNNSAAFWDLK